MPGCARHRTLAKTAVRGRSNTERQLRVSQAAFTQRCCDGTGGSAPNPPSLHQPLELPSPTSPRTAKPTLFSPSRAVSKAQPDPSHLHKPSPCALAAPKQPRQRLRALPKPPLRAAGPAACSLLSQNLAVPPRPDSARPRGTRLHRRHVLRMHIWLSPVPPFLPLFHLSPTSLTNSTQSNAPGPASARRHPGAAALMLHTRGQANLLGFPGSVSRVPRAAPPLCCALVRNAAPSGGEKKKKGGGERGSYSGGGL